MSNKIDPKFKKKWIKALSSGKYSKTTSTLRNNEGFCCLGVACDLINPKGWVAPSTTVLSGVRIANEFGYQEVDSLGRKNPSIPKDERSGYIPKRLRVKINLDDGDQDRLAAINDNSDNFERVIKYIKENL